MLEKSMPPTLCQQVAFGPFLFQYHSVSVHKDRNKWFSLFGGEEIDWPAQRTDLNPIQHLWDEPKRQLRSRPCLSSSGLDFTNALVAEWKQIPGPDSKSGGKVFPAEWKAVTAAD